MSTPISFIASTASGRTEPLGLDPALSTTSKKPPLVLARPSAICDLAEFATHKKRTFIVVVRFAFALAAAAAVTMLLILWCCSCSIFGP